LAQTQRIFLHFIRHAKTEVRSSTGMDFDRALLPKGHVQANALGNYLKNKHIHTKHTFVSDAKRTRQTAEIVFSFVPTESKSYHHELYLCELEKFLEILWKESHGNDLMFIGHNDGISEIVSYLTDDYYHLRTSEYVCLAFEVSTWESAFRGSGFIVDDFRPDVVDPDHLVF